MKTRALFAVWGCMFGVVACGSSGGGASSSGGSGGTTGGCATALCGGQCCASGDVCMANACCSPCGGSCCAAGDSCIDNACCSARQSCGTTCCDSNSACVDNACCPTARACQNICCDADSICLTDALGKSACSMNCRNSSDCSHDAPCCKLVENGQGVFSGSGVCAPTPLANAYQCLCAESSECSILGTEECVPIVNGQGYITGPYVCSVNDGSNHSGCNAKVCSDVNESCASDEGGNHYCANSCTADYLCGNPGVACCNAGCANTSGDMCCGLCPMGDGGN